MFEQQFTGGEPGDEAALPGEPATSAGAPEPDDVDEGSGTAPEGDAGGEAMSDELGEVAGGAEISELGPTA